MEKKNGQIYTPKTVVQRMWANVADDFRCKHVLDNSCGKGAFLVEIVRAYIENWMTPENVETIKTELETYIHGIEIDKEVYDQCIINLNALVKEYGISDVRWDIVNADALNCSEYDGKMDYIVGNPPYIRVHDIIRHGNSDNYKKYSFMQKGMSDSFLAFFELGLRQCKPDGKLAYIAPTSWFTSLAGQPFRELLSATHWLRSVIDLSGENIFKGVTTYPAIVLLDKSKTSSSITYQLGDATPIRLAYEEITFDRKYYFGTARELYLFGCILKHANDEVDIKVKNGFATLADKIFIDTYNCASYSIPVLKASRNVWKTAFYPYTKDGFLMREDILRQNPDVNKFLTENRSALSRRKIDNKDDAWYAYGRRQAIGDVYHPKVAISALAKNKEGLKVEFVPSGSGVYAGLYVLINDLCTREFVYNAVISDDFISYVKILRKYKSGGYYTFSSKDLEIFLKWKFSEIQNNCR